MVSNYKKLEVCSLQISLMMMKILELDQLHYLYSVLLITKKTDGVACFLQLAPARKWRDLMASRMEINLGQKTDMAIISFLLERDSLPER